MSHDYRLAYRRGMEILQKAKWESDPEGMFRPPSLAKSRPVRLECERLSVELGVPILKLSAEVMTAARIHHLIAVCGIEAEEYFLRGQCPLDPKKIALLGRRMPLFIRAKMPALLAGSVNVASNPDHAFDTDGWAELKRRLPKFRSTLEHYAAHCIGTPMQARLDEFEIERLSKKLQSIRHECNLVEQKLRTWQREDGSVPPDSPQAFKPKPAPNWLKAHRRISQVNGVLQKTNRDLNSEFWKPEWVPTEAQVNGVITDVVAMAQAAATIHAWLRQ